MPRSLPSFTEAKLKTPDWFNTPEEAKAFLESRGWVKRVTDSETNMDFFDKNGGNMFPWYEAVAMEFIHFITLGGR